LNSKLARLLLAPLILCAWAPLRAQLIDDVDFRREGDHAVMQLRFVTPVQFRRALAAGSDDAAQVFYDVVAGRELPKLVVSERRIAARGGMPEIVVTDDAVGRDHLARRLLVRLSRATPMRVRAGRGDRAIELVLEGLGPALPSITPVAPVPPTRTGGFQITLAQSERPGPNLDMPVPSSMQRYDVFTGQRQVDGRTLHEISIGYFDTVVEAQAALQTLRRRFPQAAIVALAPPVVAAAPPAAASAPAAAASATAASAPAAAAASATPAGPAPAQETAAALPSPAEIESQAAVLLAAAKAAQAQLNDAAALEQLLQLLRLPSNAATREALELAGHARLRSGDTARARAEYETFLKLYPSGPDADRVREALAGLPLAAQAAPAQPPAAPPPATLTGSASAFFFGGASKVRTQEFQDSPISGLPELASENVLSGTDQKQVVTDVDLNWRYRDADQDMRAVFRDAYTADLLDRDRSRSRLTALFFEHRSLGLGTQVRLGRQSPTGGGVLGRFDGVQAGYSFAPKWRVNAVAGVPFDKLLDSKRHFYGIWVDADALTPRLGGSLYLNQQMIDGQVDRRALGAELRYFDGGVSLAGVLDYDQVLNGLNIASLQGTWQLQDRSVFNVLLDRRSTPMLALGNALFFGTTIPAPTPADPNGTRLATSVRELLDNGFLVQDLRDSVKATTNYTTQGLLGITTPINDTWQVGADVRTTNLGEIPPIDVILPNGQGRSDNRSLGVQLIGTNLYSARDTHVISWSLLKGSSEFIDPLLGRQVASYTGQLLSYNNSSQLHENLLLEPSLKLYVQNDSSELQTARINLGLRATYRVARRVSLESELNGEDSKVTGPMRNETSVRVFYYLGGRYDF
jgi:hypothetical protein